MTRRLGLTLIEVVIVIGLITILASFTGFSFLRTRNVVSLDGVAANLETDIRSQQINSMNGFVQGGNSSPYYGIRFESNRYILFHSQTYSGSEPSNFAVNLDSDSRFSVINLPDSQLLFATQSGELSNFDPVRNFVTIENLNNQEQKTLYFNVFGTVYDTN